MPVDSSHPPSPTPDLRLMAMARIKAALDAVAQDEPETLARWRLDQLDRAIHDFMRFRYGNAIAEAERAMLPAHRIPASGLNEPTERPLDELRARIEAARHLSSLSVFTANNRRRASRALVAVVHASSGSFSCCGSS
jgi:hypothetical protein